MIVGLNFLFVTWLSMNPIPLVFADSSSGYSYSIYQSLLVDEGYLVFIHGTETPLYICHAPQGFNGPCDPLFSGTEESLCVASKNFDRRYNLARAGFIQLAGIVLGGIFAPLLPAVLLHPAAQVAGVGFSAYRLKTDDDRLRETPCGKDALANHLIEASRHIGHFLIDEEIIPVYVRRLKDIKGVRRRLPIQKSKR